jgi:hypothetical protein
MVQEQQSLTESIRIEIKKMLSDGTLIQKGKFYSLTKDYVFNSPFCAASAILGRSASGPLEWKTEDGVQLKQFEQ